MKKLERPYETTITIGADNMRELINALEGIQFSIEGYIREGEQNKHTCAAGSWSYNYNYSIIRTDTQDHDEYFKQIDAYLKGRC